MLMIIIAFSIKLYFYHFLNVFGKNKHNEAQKAQLDLISHDFNYVMLYFMSTKEFS